MKLLGKVAIITGSGQGLGEAMAKKFASEGASVVVCDINIEEAKRVVEEIKNLGGKAVASQTDVTNRQAVQNLVENTIKDFNAVHILVNNAGITRHFSLLETKEEDWDVVIDVNLKGVFNCTQAVLRQMMEQQYGKIINISSICGEGAWTEGKGNYSAAKAGVSQLTKVTAREAGSYGINVNGIAPGIIMTPIVSFRRGKEEMENYLEKWRQTTILGRVGEPDDIANMALFLASDESKYITGQVIHVDGGLCDYL